MNQSSLPLPALRGQMPSRSMGLKLIVVCGLALFMGIPASLLSILVADRAERAGNVMKEISAHVGGPQTFLGPTLAIPYTVPPRSSTEFRRQGIYLVFPVQGSAAIKTVTEERHRSLFRVPVFRAALRFEADFDLTGVPAAAPQDAELDWTRAEMVLGVSDVRGALADATLAMGSKTVTLVPAEVADAVSLAGEENKPVKLALFGARVANVVKPNLSFHATSTLRFSGAERIAILAYGKTTRVTAQGDWRSPGFDGRIVPLRRNVSDHGFTAEWSVPFIARGVRAEGPLESVAGIGATGFGVSFIEAAGAYQSVHRALKYALLFLGLIFLSYFVFEVNAGKRVHPAQYILVGIAQIIFYLLLLSLAERVGFDAGFWIAGAATVLLLSSNAGWIFSSHLQALRALIAFSLLYSLIYMLLRLEDNALLIGAIVSFLAVSAAMYMTRGIDWYSSLPGRSRPAMEAGQEHA